MSTLGRRSFYSQEKDKMAGYRPMTVAGLAVHLSRAAGDRTRWEACMGIPGGVSVGAS
jgi:hypothetical protein